MSVMRSFKFKCLFILLLLLQRVSISYPFKSEMNGKKSNFLQKKHIPISKQKTQRHETQNSIS